MRVHIPKSKGLRGPKIFCNRLSKAMSKNPDVELVDPARSSIQLHSVILQNARKGVKNVLRLDGVYHHVGPEYDWRKRNVPIKESFDRADGVIYQSDFSKTLCEKYLGEVKVPHTIIYNGADPEAYLLSSSKDIYKRPFFLAVANWRAFKRLEDIVESFLLANLKGVDLVVVGDVSKSGIGEKIDVYEKHPRIRFLGVLNQIELIPYYVSCLALVHISWIDNCPNSVVEAICAKKPVICGNIGGTKELVDKSGGIVLGLEEEYDLEPRDLYRPPPIDRELVVSAMIRCLCEKFDIQNSHVDIQNVAKKYLKFFKKLL